MSRGWSVGNCELTLSVSYAVMLFGSETETDEDMDDEEDDEQLEEEQEGRKSEWVCGEIGRELDDDSCSCSMYFLLSLSGSLLGLAALDAAAAEAVEGGDW